MSELRTRFHSETRDCIGRRSTPAHRLGIGRHRWECSPRVAPASRGCIGTSEIRGHTRRIRIAQGQPDSQPASSAHPASTDNRRSAAPDSSRPAEPDYKPSERTGISARHHMIGHRLAPSCRRHNPRGARSSCTGIATRARMRRARMRRHVLRPTRPLLRRLEARRRAQSSPNSPPYSHRNRRRVLHQGRRSPGTIDPRARLSIRDRPRLHNSAGRGRQSFDVDGSFFPGRIIACAPRCACWRGRP